MTAKSRVGEQLETLKKQLEMDRDEVLRKSTPLRRQRDELVAKIQPLELQLRQVDDQIKELERPMYEIGNGLAQLARVGGGKIITNGQPEPALAPVK